MPCGFFKEQLIIGRKISCYIKLVEWNAPRMSQNIFTTTVSPLFELELAKAKKNFLFSPRFFRAPFSFKKLPSSKTIQSLQTITTRSLFLRRVYDSGCWNIEIRLTKYFCAWRKLSKKLFHQKGKVERVFRAREKQIIYIKIIEILLLCIRQRKFIDSTSFSQRAFTLVEAESNRKTLWVSISLVLFHFIAHKSSSYSQKNK